MSSSTDVLTNGSLHEYGCSAPRTPTRRCAKSSGSSPGIMAKDLTDEVQEEIEHMIENVPQVEQFFKIINKIGSGTFSSVYVARLKNHPNVNKLFALKHLIPTSHPSRIESELRCLYDIGGLNNVMGVQACFRERDHVVIVMPYFAHERFQDYVQLLMVAEVREYMKHLLISLRRVHEVDIIHRDVKPSNFLFNRTLKQYALVDFGLAQKAPVLLKHVIDNKTETKSQQSLARKTRKQSVNEQITTSPRKRKISQHDVENMPVSPCKKRVVSDNTQNLSIGLAVIDLNKQNLGAKSITESPESKPDESIKPEISLTPPGLMKPVYGKPVKSPRRLLLTKRALDQHRALSEQPRDKGHAELLKKRPVVVLERDGRSMYKAMAPSSCMCYGKAVICSVCMARSSQHAPRAGTPGFRAPEVLMKCPDQTTAVDIWSAGVIFLSLLSGRYPFFKAQDDMTALAQIISTVGSDNMKTAALSFGKNLLCNPKTPSVNLEIMCQQLRRSTPSARQFRQKGDTTSEQLVKDWENVPSCAFDLLKKLLNPNPTNRMTADDALKHSFFIDDEASD